MSKKRSKQNNEWYEESWGTETLEIDDLDPDYCYECGQYEWLCECHELIQEDQDCYQQSLFDHLEYEEIDYEDEEDGYEDGFSQEPDRLTWGRSTYNAYSPSKRIDLNERVLYFAFGSNMEMSQMMNRCPTAQKIDGHYTLDGYRLTFCGHSNKWGGGVATIVKDDNQLVLGRLYSLTWGDICKLDGFEGHPYVYKRQYITLTDGQRVLTYIKPVKNNESRPSHSYFTTIARGYQQVGYELDKLVDSSIR